MRVNQLDAPFREHWLRRKLRHLGLNDWIKVFHRHRDVYTGDENEQLHRANCAIDYALVSVLRRSLRIQAINSPSATGVGEVLAVFSENVEESDLNATFVEEWREVSDVRS